MPCHEQNILPNSQTVAHLSHIINIYQYHCILIWSKLLHNGIIEGYLTTCVSRAWGGYT